MLRWISFIALGLLTLSCSTMEIDDDNPMSLYRGAEADIENDRYQLALDKLRMLQNKHPYSKYSILAQLKTADVHFLMDSFEEAAASYEAFLELHPKHERVSYASFRVGESHFNSMPGTPARDLSAGFLAQDAFETFLKRFSTDPKAPDARKNLLETKEFLAKKQLYIADFYYGEDQYESAEGRYENILSLYPETKSAQKAQARLTGIRARLSKKTPPTHERTGELIYLRYRK